MRKLSVIFALLVVLVMVLGACGGAAPAAPAAPADTAAAGTDATAAEATVDPSLPTPEPTPVVNAFGACDDPMKLWHGLTGSDGAVFAELLQQYAEANPEACFEVAGHSVGLLLPEVSDRRCRRHARPTWSSSMPPKSQQMANEGLMQPLDDFYDDQTAWAKDQFNEVLINAIYG